MRTLVREIGARDLPAVEQIARQEPNRAFRVLMATLLSARTKDATTDAASARLFAAAATPAAMAALSVRHIERLIYPVSFYRHKARYVRAASRLIVERFGGRVPGRMDQLLALPGVGRKTANLVLILAFGSRDHICVDTHVHRISNRLGWVRTRTPGQTEQALYRVADRRFWADINLCLVTWGQQVCRPVRPRCQACAVSRWCRRVGVG
jgi:endonuclease-3